MGSMKMPLANGDDEQTFKQMWKEARIRFEETTKKTLVQSKNRSLDDVLKELDKRFNGNDMDDVSIFSTTLSPGGGEKRDRFCQLSRKNVTVLGNPSKDILERRFFVAPEC